MKTVYLLRHAKSSWDFPELRDHERPLAARGRRAAPAMGRFMQEEGLIPDLVLCSTAVRARLTWDLVRRELEAPVYEEFTSDLYHAGAADMIDLLRETDDVHESVMLVGHNPGMQSLALTLADDGDPDALDRIHRKYPTGALALIDFELERWRDLEPGHGRLRVFVRPRELES